MCEHASGRAAGIPALCRLHGRQGQGDVGRGQPHHGSGQGNSLLLLGTLVPEPDGTGRVHRLERQGRLLRPVTHYVSGKVSSTLNRAGSGT